MEICGQYFDHRVIGQIEAMVGQDPLISRRALSRRVCELLSWRAPNGKLREAGCRKALVELHRRGRIRLPEAETEYSFHNRCARGEDELPKAEEITCSLEELGKLELIPISSRYSKASRTWNALMSKHHYIGGVWLRGAQIRYQVSCEKVQWLGALSFSASTWRLKDRDKWIGWNEKARRANLQRVVCNSRFLILPFVKVANLASHVLGLALSRLCDDWEQRYGYRPVLAETFVDPTRYSGTCYLAANWTKVGRTTGRTYKQIDGSSTEKKDILVYPLCPEWKDIVCHEPESRKRPSCFDDWTEEEFGSVELYDTRLKKRLFTIARDFSCQPGALIPQACDGCQAKTKAAYRFFKNGQVSMEKLLKGHIESTVERIKPHSMVLAVQDTTTLTYTAHPSIEGLGPINTTANSSKGLLLHGTMAFTPKGTPLGLLNVQCWARDPAEAGKKYRRKGLPIEEKESLKWVTSYRAVAEIQEACPDTTLVSIGDRESDIYELFHESQKNPGGPKLLIRSERTRKRRVGDESLWDRMSRERVSGCVVIRVPRRGTRPAREAKLEVRFGKVELTPPNGSGLAPVSVWAVYARETAFDPGVTAPIEWMLLTTIKVETFEDAADCLSWYTCRWNIELYHKTLKTGCRIEDRWLDNTDSLESCLAIDMVVAWRVFWLTKSARETPDAPCDVFFDRDEWRVLAAWSTKKRPPTQPPTLGQAVRIVGALGGFLGRKGDGHPGITTVWRGLQKLEAMTIGFTLAEAHFKQRDGP
ncbi:MAG: IS4 family transposase [Desulfomonilaceae bacterium]